jgi:hypothetical protein
MADILTTAEIDLLLMEDDEYTQSILFIVNETDNDLYFELLFNKDNLEYYKTTDLCFHDFYSDLKKKIRYRYLCSNKEKYVDDLKLFENLKEYIIEYAPELVFSFPLNYDGISELSGEKKHMTGIKSVLVLYYDEK